MTRTTATMNKAAQVEARAAAKAARIDEAGIRSRRKGNLSATTQRAQGKRDAKGAAAEAEKERRAKARSDAKRDDSTSLRTKSAAHGAKSVLAARQDGRVLTVQVNTSSRVPGNATFVAQARETIRTALRHFQARLTRVEAHFDDVNADKGGTDDKRCTLEARPASMPPVSASATAATARQALRGALMKVRRVLTTRLAKRAKQNRGHHAHQASLG